MSASKSPTGPQHTRTESRPRGGTPPRDDEPEQPPEPGAPGLRGPQVYRARGRRGGADLGDDGGGDESEDHGYEVACPVHGILACYQGWTVWTVDR